LVSRTLARSSSLTLMPVSYVSVSSFARTTRPALVVVLLMRSLYGYVVDGVARNGERYSLRGAGWTRDRVRAEELVKEYPEGSGQVCHGNPRDPDQAVLKRDSKAPLYSLWFPLLFVVGGAGMIAGVIRRLRFA